MAFENKHVAAIGTSQPNPRITHRLLSIGLTEEPGQGPVDNPIDVLVLNNNESIAL